MYNTRILFSSMIVRRLLSTVRPGFSLSPTIRQLLDSRLETERIVTVCGWIKSVRRQKNVAFAAITDGSDAKGIQAVLSKGIDDETLRRSQFCVSMRVAREANSCLQCSG
jgi:asparaginyl-tRNA synthetase